jgi:hypothetical protein
MIRNYAFIPQSRSIERLQRSLDQDSLIDRYDLTL